jgi:hypothetical protein
MSATDTVFWGRGWCIGREVCWVSWKLGFWGRGCVCGGGRLLIDGSASMGGGRMCSIMSIGGGACCGGSRTTGRHASGGTGGRETTEPVGENM